MPPWYRVFAILFLALGGVARAAELVPAWLIRLPENTPAVFVAETAAAAFHRFDRAGEGVARIGEDYMSIGLEGTGKSRAGDRRTPLGIYFVTERLDTSRLHEKYGARAYPLDYPNAWDRRHGRGGDGIWVHGIDPRRGKRPSRDTDGCIALPNERLIALEDAFVANVTPVIIGESIPWVDAADIDATRASLEEAIYRWADALEQGDMVAWLDLYASDFERWGMNREEWASFSLQTIAERPITAVTISELLLLGHPVEENLYFSRFRLEIAEGAAHKVDYKRRIYWRRLGSGAWKIAAEDGG